MTTDIGGREREKERATEGNWGVDEEGEELLDNR